MGLLVEKKKKRKKRGGRKGRKEGTAKVGEIKWAMISILLPCPSPILLTNQAHPTVPSLLLPTSIACHFQYFICAFHEMFEPIVCKANQKHFMPLPASALCRRTCTNT
jgi:hypothetical protein